MKAGMVGGIQQAPTVVKVRKAALRELGGDALVREAEKAAQTLRQFKHNVKVTIDRGDKEISVNINNPEAKDKVNITRVVPSEDVVVRARRKITLANILELFTSSEKPAEEIVRTKNSKGMVDAAIPAILKAYENA